MGGKWRLEFDREEYEWARARVKALAIESPLMQMKPADEIFYA